MNIKKIYLKYLNKIKNEFLGEKMHLRANFIRFLFKFPFPYVESELLFPMKIRKVRGTSSSNLPR